MGSESGITLKGEPRSDDDLHERIVCLRLVGGGKGEKYYVLTDSHQYAVVAVAQGGPSAGPERWTFTIPPYKAKQTSEFCIKDAGVDLQHTSGRLQLGSLPHPSTPAPVYFKVKPTGNGSNGQYFAKFTATLAEMKLVDVLGRKVTGFKNARHGGLASFQVPSLAVFTRAVEPGPQPRAQGLSGGWIKSVMKVEDVIGGQGAEGSKCVHDLAEYLMKDAGKSKHEDAGMSDVGVAAPLTPPEAPASEDGRRRKRPRSRDTPANAAAVANAPQGAAAGPPPPQQGVLDNALTAAGWLAKLRALPEQGAPGSPGLFLTKAEKAAAKVCLLNKGQPGYADGILSGDIEEMIYSVKEVLLASKGEGGK